MHLDYLITKTHMSMPHNPEKKKKVMMQRIFLNIYSKQKICQSFCLSQCHLKNINIWIYMIKIRRISTWANEDISLYKLVINQFFCYDFVYWKISYDELTFMSRLIRKWEILSLVGFNSTNVKEKLSSRSVWLKSSI